MRYLELVCNWNTAVITTRSKVQNSLFVFCHTSKKQIMILISQDSKVSSFFPEQEALQHIDLWDHQVSLEGVARIY